LFARSGRGGRAPLASVATSRCRPLLECTDFNTFLTKSQALFSLICNNLHYSALFCILFVSIRFFVLFLPSRRLTGACDSPSTHPCGAASGIASGVPSGLLQRGLIVKNVADFIRVQWIEVLPRRPPWGTCLDIQYWLRIQHWLCTQCLAVVNLAKCW